jgi:hypothetical protein
MNLENGLGTYASNFFWLGLELSGTEEDRTASYNALVLSTVLDLSNQSMYPSPVSAESRPS